MDEDVKNLVLYMLKKEIKRTQTVPIVKKIKRITAGVGGDVSENGPEALAPQ